MASYTLRMAQRRRRHEAFHKALERKRERLASEPKPVPKPPAAYNESELIGILRTRGGIRVHREPFGFDHIIRSHHADVRQEMDGWRFWRKRTVPIHETCVICKRRDLRANLIEYIVFQTGGSALLAHTSDGGQPYPAVRRRDWFHVKCLQTVQGCALRTNVAELIAEWKG